MERLPFVARRLAAALALASALPCLAACSESASSARGEPEERMTFAISQVSIMTDKHPPAEGWNLAFEALDEVRGGKDFAQVARSRSEDPESAPLGGFLGFVRPQGQDVTTGAIQALPIGVAGGPIQTERALIVIKRHAYAEAKALEERYMIPLYGFFIRYGQGAGAQFPERAEAEKAAREAWEKVKSKELTIVEAAKRYAESQSDRPNAFTGYARPVGERRAVYDAVKGVAPGELAPLVPIGEEAFGILVRGHHLRCIARHILIAHSQSQVREMAVARSREEAKAIAEKVLAEVDPEGANWPEMVKRYSDEKGSALQGGTLGCIGNGDLLPDLEAPLIETPPGRVCPHLVETPVGFHVMWRVD